MEDRNRFWRLLLLVMSLAFITLTLFAGLMRSWHRFVFISLEWLNTSALAVTLFFVLGIGLWMAAHYLPRD